ncbi:MAG: hypothetical protein AAB867_03305 [Patescibacteria group bacterium]
MGGWNKIPQREDIMPYLEAKQQEEEDRKVDQLRHQAGIGVVMSELQAEPKWAIYGNHLKALQEYEERKVKNYQDRLLGGDFLTSQVYGQLKINLAKAEGMVAGFQQALNLAKELIESGERAENKLKQNPEEGL